MSQAAVVAVDETLSLYGQFGLLAPRDLSQPIAWRAGRPVSGHHFLADARLLASRLPASGPAVNLCGDRYAFAVAMAAALQRGHASLLPPDSRPDTLAQLAGGGQRPYALIDDESLATPGLERVLVGLIGLGEGGPAPHESEPIAFIANEMHAASLLTSGSTGVPQPHAKSWGTLVANITTASSRLAQALGMESLAALTLLATVPAQHSYGLESTVLLAMLGGAAFDASRAFYPADIAQALASVPRPRALVTTPFHLKTLLRSGVELPTVDLILSATAPLSPQLAAEAEVALSGMLLEIYGSTETGQIATRRTTDSEIWQTLDGVEVQAEAATADDDAMRFVAQGGFIAAPTVLADVLDLIDPQHFRLLGRANDLIHVAGRRSSLAALDFQLNSVPGVIDGSCWMPDEVHDEVVRPVAFAVAPGLSAAQIVAALRDRLEAVFVPRQVFLLDSLPRVGTGKLTAGTLRELARTHMTASSPLAAPTMQPLQWTVPRDHPVFAGHFPTQPLMPGALLLAQVADRLAERPELADPLGASPTLASAKFLAPVRPGCQVRLVFTPGSAGATVDFTLHAEGTLAVQGRWMRAAPAEAPVPDPKVGP